MKQPPTSTNPVQESHAGSICHQWGTFKLDGIAAETVEMVTQMLGTNVMTASTNETVGVLRPRFSPAALYDEGHFHEVLAVFDRALSGAEIRRVSGALGYALRQVFRGESLSDADVFGIGDERTALAFRYNSTKAHSGEFDIVSAFELAERYIREGSPIRTTNRSGADTKGTRLVEGVGPVGVEFYVG